ncbi:MAG: TonB-dependent receptor plug domain-containing protein, partial [Halieaceae bacterium]
MKLFKLSRKSLTRLAVSMACVASGSSAWAQLEEVVVTATKRAESVQDIPMSVEVVSGERLQNMAIRSFADLAVEIPNFFVGDGVVTTNVNMRGMGSGGERAFEQSVGMFI